MFYVIVKSLSVDSIVKKLQVLDLHLELDQDASQPLITQKEEIR